MKILCDIDGFLTKVGVGYSDYANAVPNKEEIDKVNQLALTDEVVLYTSRLSCDKTVTEEWLAKNNVSYSSIIFDKPKADLYLDNKALSFIPNMNTDKKLRRKKLVICYSGGMDSFIAYHYAVLELKYNSDDIICINFDIGQPYREKEKQAIQDLGIKCTTFKIDLIRPELTNVPDINNYIIPARNLIFSTIAGSFGERVWIIGMKYENHYLMYDKNEDFYQTATIALSQAIGEITIVESPFRSMTKTDIVQWAKLHKVDISNTVSCYHPTLKRCGICSLCFKRYIAMKACGLSENYSSDPSISEVGNKLIRDYKSALKNKDFTHYHRERIEETLRLVELARI